MTGLKAAGRLLDVTKLKLILCLALALVACGKTEPVYTPDTPQETPRASKSPNFNRGLANLQTSPEALARQILAQLIQGNKKALRELLVDQKEFCKYLWPEFPAHDIPNTTCEWVWGMDEAKSLSSLQRLLDTYAGKKYEFIGLDLGQPLEYKTFRIHKNPVVVIKDQAGKIESVALFGPILEIDGGYKLYSYYSRD